MYYEGNVGQTPSFEGNVGQTPNLEGNVGRTPSFMLHVTSMYRHLGAISVKEHREDDVIWVRFKGSLGWGSKVPCCSTPLFEQ